MEMLKCQPDTVRTGICRYICGVFKKGSGGGVTHNDTVFYTGEHGKVIVAVSKGVGGILRKDRKSVV